MDIFTKLLNKKQFDFIRKELYILNLNKWILILLHESPKIKLSGDNITGLAILLLVFSTKR